jgi:hypothetical protein
MAGSSRLHEIVLRPAKASLPREEIGQDLEGCFSTKNQ